MKSARLCVEEGVNRKAGAVGVQDANDLSKVVDRPGLAECARTEGAEVPDDSILPKHCVTQVGASGVGNADDASRIVNLASVCSRPRGKAGPRPHAAGGCEHESARAVRAHGPSDHVAVRVDSPCDAAVYFRQHTQIFDNVAGLRGSAWSS